MKAFGLFNFHLAVDEWEKSTGETELRFVYLTKPLVHWPTNREVSYQTIRCLASTKDFPSSIIPHKYFKEERKKLEEGKTSPFVIELWRLWIYESNYVSILSGKSKRVCLEALFVDVMEKLSSSVVIASIKTASLIFLSSFILRGRNCLKIGFLVAETNIDDPKGISGTPR